jgi:putative SOS response-associated peptidase YedK
MCGHFTVTIDKSTIEKRFGGRFYIARQEFEPTFNAAPSQLLPINPHVHRGADRAGQMGLLAGGVEAHEAHAPAQQRAP